jgi:outer membrane protein TolC
MKVLLPFLFAASLSAQTLNLSLRTAVDLALQPNGSTRLQIAEEMIHQARARSGETRAALLPDFSGAISYQNETANLAAFGFHFQIPIPGVVIPTFVGPFDVFDARASVTQSVFDFSAIRRFQASRMALKQAQSETDSTRDLVIDQVARAYLAAERATAVHEAAQANVELSEALLKLSQDQKNAGTGTSIEVTRAQVQLANDRQQLLVADNDYTRTRLQLLKVIGLRLTTDVHLTGRLDFIPTPATPPDEAVVKALAAKPEWKAQAQREETARLNHSAVKAERLPSVASFANYGSSGNAIDNSVPTRTYGISVRVPIFDGGRRDYERAESVSQLRQEQVRTRDLRDQIELDIRVALENLRSTELQVTAAREGLQLSENELAQARRRYEAGLVNGVEVTDAQTRLARARENLTNALFNHNVARIDLGTATGSIRQMLP